MPSLEELIREKERLDREIDRARTEQRAAALAQIQHLMSTNGLTTADLNQQRQARQPRYASGPVPVKYRDDAGNVWSGRGLKPKWLAAAIASGKRLEDFAV